LREGCRLTVFENRVLRRIFGPRRDEITGEWRRLHNKELYALYSTSNTIQVMKSTRLTWVGHVARVDIRETGWGGMDWIDLAQDRDRWWALVNAAMNLRVS
jgi:hypothetical protein